MAVQYTAANRTGGYDVSSDGRGCSRRRRSLSGVLMLWCVLQVSPPDFMPPVRGEAVEAEVRRVAAECGDRVVARVARTRAEVESIWADVRRQTDPAAVAVAVVCGHGQSVRLPGRDEPVNILYAGDTREFDRTATSVDLDELFQRAAPPAPGPLLVVLDVCAVRVRESHGAGSLAVLLGNPGGNAESTAAGGLLSKSFLRAYAGAPAGATFRDVVRSAIDRTRAETSGRQTPQLVQLGDQAFLDRIARASPTPPVAAREATGAMVRVLVELARGDRLPLDVVNRLDEEVLGGAAADDDTLLELRLITAVLRLKDDPNALGGARAVRRLYDRSGDAVSPLTKARAAHLLGWSHLRAGHPSQALALLEEALAELPDEAAPELRSQLLDTRGTAHREALNFRLAVEAYEASFRLKEGVGDVLGREMTRQNLGWGQLLRGRFEDGENCFREGLETCRGLLDRGHPGGVEVYKSVLASLHIHLVGLATSRFFRPIEPARFRELMKEVRLHLDQADRFAAWGVGTQARLARLLLALGCRTGDAPPVPVEPPLLDFWGQVRVCVVEGAHRIGDVEELSLRRLEGGSGRVPDFARISYLAGLNYLSQVLDSRSVVAARDRLLRWLRDHGYDGLPPPDGPPWAYPGGADGLQVDTSFWPTWGPLAAQTAQTKLPDLIIEPKVTEHYIQLLSWMSGLLLALEGGVDCPRLLRLLDEDFPDGGSVKLGLGQSLQFAHRVAALADCQSEWGRELKRVWEEKTFVPAGGYAAIQDIPGQRNQTSHFKVLTRPQARHILEQHTRVIREMVRPLPAELPAILSSGRAVSDRNAEIQSVILSDSRHRRLDCGPLLVTQRDNPAHLYVPHELDRPTLQGKPNGKCTFKFYGTGLGAQGDQKLNVRWPPAG